MMNRLIRLLLAMLAVAAASAADGQTFTVLGSFNGTNGASPNGSLTLSGSTLYGMTNAGGVNGYGNVFSINTDGSGFQNLLAFSGGTDGNGPAAGLTPSGSTLYGTTFSGGANGQGNVFSINTDGTGFQNLLSFTGGTDGNGPAGNLTLSGSTLYGTTGYGGVYGDGNIFSIHTDGSGFQSLLSFSGSNGYTPTGSLTLSGSTLYGTTGGRLAVSEGTVFSIHTDGSGFQTLVTFTGGRAPAPGAGPNGSLALSGSTLYGTTSESGPMPAGAGTIFSVNTDGTDFQNLLRFSGTEGGDPSGGLTLVGSTLYGTNQFGGDFLDGDIFSINTDGTGFQNLFSFDGANGQYPVGDLTLVGSTLYGTTTQGGDNGDGVVFALTIPEPSTMALLAAAALGVLGYVWRRRRAAARQ
jgi:uncharacterized repeat protein (TIGR03803 family)